MSRIGKHPIPVPDGVQVALDGKDLTVKGKNGELAMRFVDEVEASFADGAITVKLRDSSKRARAMWGMQRSLANNLVIGVTDGFKIDLEINGVGYRAAVNDRVLTLQLGYSHDIKYPIPDGIEVKVEKNTKLEVSGFDKQQVGQVAAEIRALRPPDVYKLKGVRYAGERLRKKAGKTGA